MFKLIMPAVTGLAAAFGCMEEAIAASPERAETGGIMQLQRDPEIAVREEFAHFEAKGTIEAYELFIARHPDHQLAEEARQRIAAIRRGERGN